jgi:hypothetical protein
VRLDMYDVDRTIIVREAYKLHFRGQGRTAVWGFQGRRKLESFAEQRRRKRASLGNNNRSKNMFEDDGHGDRRHARE